MKPNYVKKIANFIQKNYDNCSNFALTTSSVFFIFWGGLLFFMNYEKAAVLSCVASFMITLFIFNPFVDFSKKEKTKRILARSKKIVLFLGSVLFIIIFIAAILFSSLSIADQFSKITKGLELIMSFVAFVLFIAFVLVLMPITLLLIVYFLIENIKNPVLKSFFYIIFFIFVFFVFLFKKEIGVIYLDTIFFFRKISNERLFVEIIKLVFGFGLVFLHSNYLLKECVRTFKNKRDIF